MDERWRELAPDAQNSTPLYLQLAARLATAIHAGTWSAGEALPSERTLSDGVGVSRITARKAIALLVEQGLIRRVRGAGSFITPRVEDPLSRLTGFTTKMQQRGFRPDSVWLERESARRAATKRCNSDCRRVRAVASLRRLRRADGIVMAVEHSALPASVVPRAACDRRVAVSGIWKSAALSVVRALQHFRAVNAGARSRE